MKRILNLLKNSLKVIWKRHHFLIPPKYWKKYVKSFYKKLTNKKDYYHPFDIKDYNKWLKENQKDIIIKKFKSNPLISFVIPVYNIEKKYLSECLDSILEQSYTNFEICIADDCSTSKETIETLKVYEKKDKRIKVVYRKENGHISKATNSALEIAKGEFVALMDDDDLLDKNALYYVVEAINEDKNIDMIYTDEDKLDMEGNFCEPHFKPDFSIDSLFGGNYFCHFTVIKKAIFDKIGNFNSEFVGAQDFDLFLRATEVANNVHHISEILYHWRKIPGSTADNVSSKTYAIENGKKAVEESLKRRGLDATVEVPIECTHYVVNYNLNTAPLLSIIMLDVNKKILLNNLNQFLFKNNYQNIEFIVNSNDFKINKKFPKILYNNTNDIDELIKLCNGQYILFVSGKIKFDSADLLMFMLGYASQSKIGIIGPKIYHFSKSIKSAGLIISSNHIYSNAFHDYFTDSVGFYGRLVVPYDYAALSNRFFMFEKKKYDKIKNFSEFKNFDIANIDFSLKMLSLGYRNVLLSNRYISQKDFNTKKHYELDSIESKLLNKRWNLDENKYYNKNLSKKFPFMLNKGDTNEKK